MRHRHHILDIVSLDIVSLDIVSLGIVSLALILLLVPSRVAAAAEAPRKLSSSENRRNLQYELLLNPVGISSRGAGAGAMLGFMLDADLWLELGGLATRGSASDSRSEINETFAVGRLKCFVSNSFYVYAGAAQRDVAVRSWRLSANDDYLASPTDRGRPYRLDNRTIGSVVGLGNQWQWSRFAIGADWSGFYSPLAAQTSHASDLDRLDEARSYDHSPTAFLGNFWLGYSL